MSPPGHEELQPGIVLPEAASSASGLSSPPRSSPEPEGMGMTKKGKPGRKSLNHNNNDNNNNNNNNNDSNNNTTSTSTHHHHHNPPSQPATGATGATITAVAPVVDTPTPPAPPQPPQRKKPGRKPKSHYAALAALASSNNGGDASTSTAAAAAAAAAAAVTPPPAADAPKVRRTRKPKDPNAPLVQRRKRHALPDTASNSASEGRRADTPTFAAIAPDPSMNPSHAGPSQNGKTEDIQRPINSFFTAGPPQSQSQPQLQSQSQPPPPPQQQQQQQQLPPNPQQYQQQQPPPPPQQQHQHQHPHLHPPPSPSTMRTSGQNYDPIRSNYDPVRETVISQQYPHPHSQPQGSPNQPPHAMNRASASPSISSLVDPPNQVLTSPSIAAQSFFNQQQQQQQHHHHHHQARLHQTDGHGSVPQSPTMNRLAPSMMLDSASSTPSKQQQPHSTTNMAPRKSDGLDLAAVGPAAMVKKGSLGPGSTATSSAAASPKPPKIKDAKDVYPAPPPLPGSGLMQLGGIGDAPGDGTEFRAPTVVLNIPMQGEVNKIINFTRMAEERYGWDALHPRLAAQRDRLARVAAAGAALERNGSGRDSGDDMSLDSEAEGSNVEMGGMSDGRAGTDGGAKKIPRKRRMKEDEYDKDDGFVDDSELLWEEQAAAATDGFFVYSGPLIPEEKPAPELRADGAPKRGRGRGSRGGTSRSTSGRGGAVGINARTGLPLSGPGSRGGSTTRKPRITKADRARMEQEKLERERMGSMASMPNTYSGMAQLASAGNIGTTPMVFNQ